MGTVLRQPVIYPAQSSELQTDDLLPAFKLLCNGIAPVGVKRSEIVPHKDELSHFLIASLERQLLSFRNFYWQEVAPGLQIRSLIRTAKPRGSESNVYPSTNFASTLSSGFRSRPMTVLKYRSCVKRLSWASRWLPVMDSA